jgi:hypothetical protein
LFKGMGRRKNAITKTLCRLVWKLAQLLGNTAAVCRKSYPPASDGAVDEHAVEPPPRPPDDRRQTSLTVSDAALAFFKTPEMTRNDDPSGQWDGVLTTARWPFLARQAGQGVDAFKGKAIGRGQLSSSRHARRRRPPAQS